MPEGYYALDRDAGFDIAPDFPHTLANGDPWSDDAEYEIWSNALGCFDRPPPPASVLRRGYVLLVGDSFTQGTVAWEHTWGRQFERLIGAPALKCGVSAYGTHQELLKARKVVARLGVPPKLLVVGWFVNDLQDDYTFPQGTVVEGRGSSYRELVDAQTGRLAQYPADLLASEARAFNRYGVTLDCSDRTSWRRARCELTRRWRLVRLLRRALIGRRPQRVEPGREASWLSPGGHPWLRRAWARHLRSFEGLRALARRERCRLLVVLFPSREQVYPFLVSGGPPEAALAASDAPQRRLAAAQRARGIASLDLLPALRAAADETPRPRLDARTDLYGDLDWHLTAKGHALAAKVIAGEVLRRGLAPRRGPR